ncbi:TnsA endonuclease N-terminal domain-containing protein [Heliobacterium chlorum]|uniref:TnsA endonuclease N-terminal domain-containing protein n=1 Tax=Heliobacterium chlorum TaxID=2698 RepID=A0ABR7T0H4_HELCL|nr:TnsA endonuclease N-terminal domain-containing protein [Heliobacterium chlorum]MBC9784294.1 TnsA endonuclease N-terminal domain-containing protein [Heliobacterium chlorum]
MSKGSLNWDEGKIERYYKQGRGQGEGKEYKPWLTVQDVPSTGRVTRIKGWKTERLHHLLSDLEKKFFYTLQWADNVVDIQEQYPLNRDKTVAIAERKKISHPEDRANKTPLVQTTDFFIKITNQGKTEYLARAVKPSTELEKPRTLKKLEIERTYWQEQNIDWAIITELDINNVLASNVEWIHPAFWLDGVIELEADEEKRLLANLVQSILRHNGTVQSLVGQLDQEYRMESGTYLALFKHLLARKQIRTDFAEQKITPHLNIKEFSLSSSLSLASKKVKRHAVR